MPDRVSIVTIGLCSIAVQLIGCTSPAPQRVAVPPRDQAKDYGRVHDGDEMKPLPAPPERETALPRPYDDAPLVGQRPPEQREFLEAYDRVGRPRFMVTASKSDVGEVDLAAVESLLSDWLSAGGRVTLLSPSVAPAPATNSASPQADADILVRSQINARDAGQDHREARIITEAFNTRGGESIARAVVDVAMPLEKARLNEATRFIARKLMDEMTESWNRLADAPRTTAAPPPPQAPAGPVPPPSPAIVPAPAPPPPTLAPSRPEPLPPTLPSTQKLQ